MRVVLPASDGAMVALLPWRERLAAAGCLLALPSDTALEVATNKDRTLEVARSLGIEHPKTMRVDCADEIPDMLAMFSFDAALRLSRPA
ncbi:MAG: hypothetical protein ABJB47_05300 [Actinomycetota bacterium]